mmetsp:Transcript_3741/g.10864  ORF Transcript_3741/g.10864 Transcript_3741/m.10864 type:complete len:278 (+) Transcript_3741:91-924(+)
MSLLKTATAGGVRTLRFNSPRKLNAWSLPAIKETREALAEAASDSAVDAVVLTGTGEYYCAGVDLAAVLKPMPPRKLVGMIESLNKQLFEQYIDFPKPIFAAINGPTIGAAATSATLLDGVLANQRATFHTPFASLGLVPEGCSSVIFPKLFGDELANKMLHEGHKMTAQEAHEHGMVNVLVETEPSEGEDTELLNAAITYAEAYVAEKGRKRSRSPEELERLRQVNAEESRALAHAFVSPAFFRAMEAQAARKGRTPQQVVFAALRLTRPIWGMTL